MLDAVGWRGTENLTTLSMLEPSVGAGAFLLEAVRRLLASFQRLGQTPTYRNLRPRLLSFEIHEPVASSCRDDVSGLLEKLGLGRKTAVQLAKDWVKSADFLLDRNTGCHFDVVVGNPPYLRWSRLPEPLKRAYESSLPKDAAKGDLLLAFLDKSIDALKPNGKLGFIVSDRWQFAAYAKEWRERVLPIINIKQSSPVVASDAFERSASIYAHRVVLEKRARREIKTFSRLIGDEFEIRVGPALGHTPAWVFNCEEAAAVEAELLYPFLDARDLKTGAVDQPKRRILVPYNDDGELIELDSFPKARKWFEEHRKKLSARSIIRKGQTPYWRPIDRVDRQVWNRPKILVPEISKHPRATFDTSGAIPSHGVYAIFGQQNDLEQLFDLLKDDALLERLKGRAPMVSGGCYRCYKAILRSLPK